MKFPGSKDPGIFLSRLCLLCYNKHMKFRCGAVMLGEGLGKIFSALTWCMFRKGSWL